MILYRPDEQQKYVYYKDDCQRVIASKTSPYYQMLFEKIIDELQKCRDNYVEMTAMLLREIFIILTNTITVRYALKNMPHHAA